MKIKFKIKKKKRITNTDIFEKQIYRNIRFHMIVYVMPVMVISLTVYFFMNPQLPLQSVMWGSALGLGSMIKEGSRNFWIIYAHIILIQLYFLNGGTLPDYWFFPEYSDSIYFFSVFDAIVLFFCWQFAVQVYDSLRRPLKNSGRIEKIKKIKTSAS